MAVRRISEQARNVYRDHDLDRMLKDAEGAAYDALRAGKLVAHDGHFVTAFVTKNRRDTLIVTVDTNDGITRAETSRESDAAADQEMYEEMDREYGRRWGWVIRHMPAWLLSLFFNRVVLRNLDPE